MKSPMIKELASNFQRKRKDSTDKDIIDDRNSRFSELKNFRDRNADTNPLIVQNSKGYNVLKATDTDVLLTDDSSACFDLSIASSNIPFSSTESTENTTVAVPIREANLFSCFINLSSTILGAGLLSMPYALSSVGWILGFFLLTLCGASSALSLYLLTRCARLTKYPSTFHQVASLTIPRLSWLVDLAIAIKCFGVATSYMIIISDLMPIVMHTIHSVGILQMRITWLFLSYTLLIPLTCFEHMDSLKYSSSFSFGFILILIIVVLLYATYNFHSKSILNPCLDRNTDLCYPKTNLVPSNYKSLKTLPLFIFGYTCQQNTFSMVNELKMPSQNRFNIIIFASVVVAWVIYIVTASAGYITYGSLNKPDLLNNYPETPITTLARICVSIIVFSHFPLQSHPCRTCLLSLVQWISPAKAIIPSYSSLSTSTSTTATAAALNDIHRNRRMILSALILILSFIVSASFTDLGLIMSLVGSTGSVVVMFILPGLCYYYSVAENNMYLKICSLVQLFLGIILIPLCITLVFI